MEIIQLKDTTVYLEDFKLGKGKVIVDTYDGTYSMFWGATGTANIADFIIEINPEYFSSKLLGSIGITEFCKKNTFASLRKHISDLLPWYEHLDFQKSMREKIKIFQNDVNDSNSFLYGINKVLEGLDFFLIDNRIDREVLESEFKAIEAYDFIEHKYSSKYNYLMKIHNQLCKYLKRSTNQNTPATPRP